MPDGLGFLTYKAVGSTGRLSDGEEGFLPVLSRRILVTESLPLPIRGPATKKFDFTKLLESGKSDTLQHQSLTVQMVSQPVVVRGDGAAVPDGVPATSAPSRRSTGSTPTRWPGTSPTPTRRSAASSTSGRARRRWTARWRRTRTSRAVMLEETPWVRQAQAESQARRNVGILFDDNRLNDETDAACGSWPSCSWPTAPGRGSPAGRRNDYITLYITTGFGRLRHLGVKIDVAPGGQVAGAAGRLDRRDLPRDPQDGKTRTRTTCQPDRSRCTSTAAASS